MEWIKFEQSSSKSETVAKTFDRMLAPGRGVDGKKKISNARGCTQQTSKAPFWPVRSQVHRYHPGHGTNDEECKQKADHIPTTDQRVVAFLLGNKFSYFLAWKWGAFHVLLVCSLFVLPKLLHHTKAINLSIDLSPFHFFRAHPPCCTVRGPARGVDVLLSK